MPKTLVNELDINYHILGSGEPLLLIIGLSFSMADWGDYFPNMLAQNYQVILFDNRDAGLTSESQRDYSIVDLADDAANLLDALNIPKANIFGVSMGGMIAQQLALRHPNKVMKLILGCTMAGGTCSEYGNSASLATALISGNVSELLFPQDYIYSHQQEIDELFKEANPLHSQDGPFQRQMIAFSSYDACDDIQNIKAETLILTGDSDVLIPASNSEYLDQHIPNSTLKTIADAGHGFCFSHADQVAQLIIDFLSTRRENMQDNTKAVLQIFAAYARDFNTLDPEKIPSYFHPNATLMTKEIVAFMPDTIAVKGVFKKLFDDLREKDFKSSKINSIQVKQLSENQAIVSGSAERLDSGGKPFETFGLTYTLRQEAGNWKIIFGVLHDTVLVITA